MDYQAYAMTREIYQTEELLLWLPAINLPCAQIYNGSQTLLGCTCQPIRKGFFHDHHECYRESKWIQFSDTVSVFGVWLLKHKGQNMWIRDGQWTRCTVMCHDRVSVSPWPHTLPREPLGKADGTSCWHVCYIALTAVVYCSRTSPGIQLMAYIKAASSIFERGDVGRGHLQWIPPHIWDKCL